jgi:hypothetical protein
LLRRLGGFALALLVFYLKLFGLFNFWGFV